MDWFARILIGTLVAAGIFVAVVSGCQPGLFSSPSDGGSCTEARINPFVPIHADLVDIPTVSRVFLFVILIALTIAAIPKTDYNADPNERRRSRAGPRQSLPFYKRLFLPYLCATRDP